jgi:OmpA-OmpF porin, OOP family
MKTSRELTIEFEFDNSNINPKYNRQLKELADFLKSSPSFSASIEGHTDSIGKEAYNLRLSKLRAMSVKKCLVRYGVSQNRISTIGHGLSRPAADNTTIEGRQKNRRAITILIQ